MPATTRQPSQRQQATTGSRKQEKARQLEEAQQLYRRVHKRAQARKKVSTDKKPVTAEDLGSAAKTLIKAGGKNNTSMGLNLLGRAISLNPELANDPLIWERASKAYQKLGKKTPAMYEAALHCLTKGINVAKVQNASGGLTPEELTARLTTARSRLLASQPQLASETRDGPKYIDPMESTSSFALPVAAGEPLQVKVPKKSTTQAEAAAPIEAAPPALMEPKLDSRVSAKKKSSMSDSQSKVYRSASLTLKEGTPEQRAKALGNLEHEFGLRDADDKLDFTQFDNLSPEDQYHLGCLHSRLLSDQSGHQKKPSLLDDADQLSHQLIRNGENIRGTDSHMSNMLQLVGVNTLATIKVRQGNYTVAASLAETASQLAEDAYKNAEDDSKEKRRYGHQLANSENTWFVSLKRNDKSQEEWLPHAQKAAKYGKDNAIIMKNVALVLEDDLNKHDDAVTAIDQACAALESRNRIHTFEERQRVLAVRDRIKPGEAGKQVAEQKNCVPGESTAEDIEAGVDTTLKSEEVSYDNQQPPPAPAPKNATQASGTTPKTTPPPSPPPAPPAVAAKKIPKEPRAEAPPKTRNHWWQFWRKKSKTPVPKPPEAAAEPVAAQHAPSTETAAPDTIVFDDMTERRVSFMTSNYQIPATDILGPGYESPIPAGHELASAEGYLPSGPKELAWRVLNQLTKQGTVNEQEGMGTKLARAFQIKHTGEGEMTVGEMTTQALTALRLGVNQSNVDLVQAAMTRQVNTMIDNQLEHLKHPPEDKRGYSGGRKTKAGRDALRELDEAPAEQAITFKNTRTPGKPGVMFWRTRDGQFHRETLHNASSANVDVVGTRGDDTTELTRDEFVKQFSKAAKERKLERQRGLTPLEEIPTEAEFKQQAKADRTPQPINRPPTPKQQTAPTITSTQVGDAFASALKKYYPIYPAFLPKVKTSIADALNPEKSDEVGKVIDGLVYTSLPPADLVDALAYATGRTQLAVEQVLREEINALTPQGDSLKLDGSNPQIIAGSVFANALKKHNLEYDSILPKVKKSIADALNPEKSDEVGKVIDGLVHTSLHPVTLVYTLAYATSRSTERVMNALEEERSKLSTGQSK